MARYALVIGIAEYSSNYLKSLSKTAVDAEAISALLRKYGQCEKVNLLKGRVTAQQLSEALKILLTQQAIKNEAIIYFTGHAITVTDVLGDSEGYLATSDCEVIIENGKAIDQKRAIAFTSLNKLIKCSDLSNLVLVIDACHSGDFIEQSTIEYSFTAFGIKQDYFLITACRGFEEAWAKRNEEHSVFTGAVLRGLVPERADDEGCITGDGLFDYLRSALRGSRQEPVRFGKGRSLAIIRFRPKKSPVKTSNECPYQGLKAFTPSTRQFFYGRQAVVNQLRERLYHFNFVPLIGLSGSGKSSVVRAGLIPSLGDDWHALEPIKPDVEPMAALRQSLRSLFHRASDKHQVNDLLNEQDMPSLLKMLSSAPIFDSGIQKLLLVIDQFEEVFTVCPSEEERSKFIKCVTEIQTFKESPLAIVTTMRADFLEPWLNYGDLISAIQDQAVWLGELQGENLIQAIVKPAEDQGYSFDGGLLEFILEDVKAEKNCLPLLEFALTELWMQRDSSKRELSLQAYRDMKRLTGALDKRAEDVFNHNLSNDEERKWAKYIFLELVRIGSETKDIRQRQSQLSLQKMAKNESEKSTINQVIEVLIEGRLLVRDESNEIDLAHEALMTGWKRFSGWRQEDRDLRRLVQRVKDEEKEWRARGQDARYLLQGGMLEDLQRNWPILQNKTYASCVYEFYFQSKEKSDEIDRQAREFKRQSEEIKRLQFEIVKLKQETPNALLERFQDMKAAYELMTNQLQYQLPDLESRKKDFESRLENLGLSLSLTEDLSLTEIENRKEAVNWISNHQEELTEKVFQYVKAKVSEESLTHICETYSPEFGVKSFYWDLEEFIEILGHCLVTNRPNLIKRNSPSIDHPEIYRIAFGYLKRSVSHSSDLSENAKKYVNHFLDLMVLKFS